MQDNILITGIGVVSSIGLNVEQSHDAFRSGKRGIGKIEFLETKHKSDLKAGEIKLSNRQLLEKLQIPDKAYKHHTRTSLLGILAAKEACRSAGINDTVPTALVSATTVGGMDKTEIDYPAGNTVSGYIATHPCGDSTDKIAGYLGLHGYRTTVSTACSSGANAILHGARLIRHGYVERAIVGGVDALSRFTLNGFNSLMILDKELCRPFDRDRMGLNLGEGAGFLVLESGKMAASRGSRTMALLTGYANTNDAYHQTASSPEGEAAYQAMKEALAMSGIPAGEVDYINVHGTGTENNDASEGTALVRLFGKELPPFSSTKSYTGHTLGAAAGVEAVFSVLAIREGMLIPDPGFRNPIESLGISPVKELMEGVPVRHVLSNSFGFGGNNSSLIFSKP